MSVTAERAPEPLASPPLELDPWGSALVTALSQTSQVPAYLKDRDRRFVWCSAALARLVGAPGAVSYTHLTLPTIYSV